MEKITFIPKYKIWYRLFQITLWIAGIILLYHVIISFYGFLKSETLFPHLVKFSFILGIIIAFLCSMLIYYKKIEIVDNNIMVYLYFPSYKYTGNKKQVNFNKDKPISLKINKRKTIFIIHMKNKNKLLKHLEEWKNE